MSEIKHVLEEQLEREKNSALKQLTTSNLDALYDNYLSAKMAYKENGDQGHRDKLMESVGRLMVEVYDMLSSMVIDSDFMDERKEIQRQIKKLAEM